MAAVRNLFADASEGARKVLVHRAVSASEVISLETALSYHGLIPEAVYQTASVTAARGRAFDTSIGRFTF